MSKDRGPGREGLRAWERLTGWLPGASGEADPGHALAALADIGVLRHLLDQAELAAVRAARAERKSWSEIATMLGVTRQSAWERWRELDEPPAPQPTSTRADRVLSSVTSELVGAEGPDRAARSGRRRSSVVVPNVVGRTWADALEALRGKGLVAIAVGPDIAETGRPESVVSVITDQVPESGAKVAPGAVVRLWTGRGGGAGVREPRRPRPAPISAIEARPEPSDEAVG